MAPQDRTDAFAVSDDAGRAVAGIGKSRLQTNIHGPRPELADDLKSSLVDSETFIDQQPRCLLLQSAYSSSAHSDCSAPPQLAHPVTTSPRGAILCSFHEHPAALSPSTAPCDLRQSFGSAKSRPVFRFERCAICLRTSGSFSLRSQRLLGGKQLTKKPDGNLIRNNSLRSFMRPRSLCFYAGRNLETTRATRRSVWRWRLPRKIC